MKTTAKTFSLREQYPIKSLMGNYSKSNLNKLIGVSEISNANDLVFDSEANEMNDVVPVEYVIQGNKGAQHKVQTTFTIEELKKFGSKNVIKHYAIRMGLTNYKCFSRANH